MSILAKPEDAINTRSELARIAGVSHDTYSKGKKILDSNNEEIKQQVISGKKKINTAYILLIKMATTLILTEKLFSIKSHN